MDRDEDVLKDLVIPVTGDLLAEFIEDAICSPPPPRATPEQEGMARAALMVIRAFAEED